MKELDDRTKLTALIDGELPEPEKSQLLERLQTEAPLRAGRDALHAARSGIDAAFGGLLDQAPLTRLVAALPAPPAARSVRRSALANSSPGSS